MDVEDVVYAVISTFCILKCWLSISLVKLSFCLLLFSTLFCFSLLGLASPLQTAALYDCKVRLVLMFSITLINSRVNGSKEKWKFNRWDECERARVRAKAASEMMKILGKKDVKRARKYALQSASIIWSSAVFFCVTTREEHKDVTFLVQAIKNEIFCVQLEQYRYGMVGRAGERD